MQKPQRDVAKAFKIRRYTSLRYLNAIVFFIYLYWAMNIYFVVSSPIIILPIILMASILITVKDQYASFKDNEEVDLHRSRIIYIINLALIIIVTLVTLKDYRIFFPYIACQNYALIVLGLILLTLALALAKSLKIIAGTDNIQKKYINYLEEQNNKDSKGSKINYV